MKRLYYWVEGVPENRPAGPWWYVDFPGPTQNHWLPAEDQLEKYLDGLKSILKAYIITDGSEGTPDKSKPIPVPENAEIIYIKKE